MRMRKPVVATLTEFLKIRKILALVTLLGVFAFVISEVSRASYFPEKVLQGMLMKKKHTQRSSISLSSL